MPSRTGDTADVTTTSVPAAGHDSARGAGLAIVTVSATSVQTGAAIGAQAFGAIGPAGVVAIRQLVAATLLLPTVRPPLLRYTRAQWRIVIALGLVFATMNLCMYASINRIGLALAITLEFLGPLTLALSSTRRLLDLLGAVGAGVGVYVLVLPGPSTDVPGVLLALAGGSLWACYILINRVAGRELPGVQATASASLLSAVLYLPLTVVLLVHAADHPAALAHAAAAGVLSSALPYALDLMALRLLTAGVFSVMMSIQPLTAALAGLVILGQRLHQHEIIGMSIVVLVNVVTVATARRR